MSKFYFYLTFLFLLFTACSNDSNLKENKGLIHADYITDLSDISEIDGFVINRDNSAYIAGSSYVFSKLKKVDSKGNINELKTFEDLRFFYNKLTNNSKGEILLTTNSPEIGDRIYNVNNFTIPYYTLKTNSINGVIDMRSIPNVSAIANYGDDIYIVFDSSINSLKKINLFTNTETIIAGSGVFNIKDGIGSEAHFGKASQILVKNSTIFILDHAYGQHKIRKVENTVEGWKVTTLDTDNFYYIKSIAIDDKNDLYYLVDMEGIFKIHISDNIKSSFANNEIKTIYQNKNVSVNLKYLNFIGIHDNDLYLYKAPDLIKISNFQSKF